MHGEKRIGNAATNCASKSLHSAGKSATPKTGQSSPAAQSNCTRDQVFSCRGSRAGCNFSVGRRYACHYSRIAAEQNQITTSRSLLSLFERVTKPLDLRSEPGAHEFAKLVIIILCIMLTA